MTTRRRVVGPTANFLLGIAIGFWLSAWLIVAGGWALLLFGFGCLFLLLGFGQAIKGVTVDQRTVQDWLNGSDHR